MKKFGFEIFSLPSYARLAGWWCTWLIDGRTAMNTHTFHQRGTSVNMADCFHISLRVKKLFLMCFMVFLILNSSQMRNNVDESLVVSAELPVLDCFDPLRSGFEISVAAAGLNNHVTVCD